MIQNNSLPTLEHNFNTIQKQIEKALAQSDRSREDSDLTLVAVSKSQPVKLMNELQAIYARNKKTVIFGENYLQEFLHKIPDLTQPYSAHYIGRLQSNKIPEIIKHFDLIHSVGSTKHLGIIAKEAEKIGKIQNILLQVNVSEDPNKAGFNEAEISKAIDLARKLKGVHFKGLMTITELYDDPNCTKKDFKKLRALRDKLISDPQEQDLSMGMSADFEIAISEGATIIRIGSAIFGER